MESIETVLSKTDTFNIISIKDDFIIIMTALSLPWSCSPGPDRKRMVVNVPPAGECPTCSQVMSSPKFFLCLFFAVFIVLHCR